jgi:hypothetical protein
MKTEQEILNLVFRDENGDELSVVIDNQQILNAVYDESTKSLKINIDRIPMQDDATLSGAPKILTFKDNTGKSYYFKAYPTKN